MARKHFTTQQRFDAFMSKVSPEPNSGCWLWTASITPAGYGQVFREDRVTKTSSHRLAYEMFVGPIPDGLVLDHLCRVRSCCNPQHLEPVTQKENVRRAPMSEDAKAAVVIRNRKRGADKTHCKKGHKYFRYVSNSGAIYARCGLCRQENYRALRLGTIRRGAAMAARNREITAARLAGGSLESIAEQFKITRVRVWQIANAASHDSLYDARGAK